MRVAFLDPLEARLAEFPARYLGDHEVLLTEKAGELPSGIERADAIVWWQYPVDRALIESLPELRFLQRIGVMRSKGDATAAIEKGLPVSLLPLGVSDRVAQHALALTLAVLRKIVAGHKAVESGSNPEGTPDTPQGNAPVNVNWARIANVDTLNDKRVGIIGFGEIGACYARMLRPFDCRTLYYKRSRLSPEQERHFGIEYAEMDELLATSDIIAGFLPHTEATKGLIGRREIGLMRPEAVFVNCGRGTTVDEAALCDALSRGGIAGAGLDVFEVEPLPLTSPLLGLENVVLAPHTAGGIQGWQNTFERIRENLRRAAAGEPVLMPLRPGDPQPG